MRLRVFVPTAAALVAVHALGCSALTNLDGLTGGSSLADAGDAPMDVVSSGDSARDGATSGFCSSLSPKPFLCDDFDEGKPFLATWTEVLEDGVVRVTNDLSRSAPSGLKIYVNSPSNCSYVRVQKDLPAKRHVRTSADVYLGAPGAVTFSTNGTALFGMQTALPSACLLLLDTDGTRADVHEQTTGGDKFHFLTRWPLPGTWSRLVMDVDTSVTPPSVRVLLDGEVALDDTLGPECQPAGMPMVFIGYHCHVANDPTEVHYDNVTIELP